MIDYFLSLRELSLADVRFLASPTFDLGVFAPPTLMFAIVFYRANRHRKNQFWKMTALIADVLSVVGIIGIAASAGRTILDENVRGLEAAANHSRQTLQAELDRITFGLCMPLRADARPMQRIADADSLCEQVRDLTGAGRIKRPLGIDAPDMDLNAIGDKFANYSADSRDEDLNIEARNIAGMIRAFASAKYAVPGAEFDRLSIPQLTSSRLMLDCLLITWLGLVGKLARSIREVRVEQFGGELPPIPHLPSWLARRKKLD